MVLCPATVRVDVRCVSARRRPWSIVTGFAAAVIAVIAMAPPVSARAAPATGAGAGMPTVRLAQGGILGRYVLRSVGGANLPAPVAGEDPHHKVLVMDGVLLLNSDGSYICQTIVQTTYMGLVQLEADTIHGPYSTIGGGAITFGVPPKEVDTVPSTGGQITWTHPTRRGIGIAQFIYTR